MVSADQLPLLILPATLLLMGGTFFWLWVSNQTRASSLFYGTSFSTVALSFALFVLIPKIIDSQLVLLAWALSVVSLSTALWGLSLVQTDTHKHGIAASIILSSITAISYAIWGLTPKAFVLAAEFSCLTFYCIGIALCIVGPRRNADKFLAFFMAAGVILFAMRTFMFLEGFLGEVTATSLLQSDYFQTLQFFSAVIIIGSGLSMLAGEMETRFSQQRRNDLTDPLSGLLTRKGFWDAIKISIKDANKAEIPVSLLLTDLDHFKAVNDTYGHVAGDRVIGAFGEIIQKATRDSDVAGRVGGEEFAVLLVGADLIIAKRIAERIRAALVDLVIKETNCESHSASFGVVPIYKNETFDQAYQEADRALYMAKLAGRNRVVVNSRKQPASDHDQNTLSVPSNAATGFQGT